MAADLTFEMQASAVPPLAVGLVLVVGAVWAIVGRASRSGRRMALWAGLMGAASLAVAGREAAGRPSTALLFADLAPYARLAARIALAAFLAVHPRPMGSLGSSRRGLVVFIALALYVELFYLLDPTAVETRTADGSGIRTLVEGPLRAFLRLTPAVAAVGAAWCAWLIRSGEEAPGKGRMLMGLGLLSVAQSGDIVLEAVASWGADGPGFLVTYHALALAVVLGAAFWAAAGPGGDGEAGPARKTGAALGLAVAALALHMLPLAVGGAGVFAAWIHAVLLAGAAALLFGSLPQVAPEAADHA